jgi:hypothetical protein
MSFPLSYKLRSDYIGWQVVEHLLDKWAEVLLDILQFASEIFISIKGVGRPNENKLICKLKNGLQLLPLKFAEVAIYFKVAHVFSILFDLMDEVFVGYGCIIS